MERTKDATHTTWRDISTRIWISFFVGVLAELFAGSNYAYGAWSGSLKSRFDYTQSEVALIGSLGNVGQYLSIVAGVINDARGVKVSCCLAAVLQFLGYFMMHLSTAGTVDMHSAGMQAFWYFVASTGSNALFISGVTANVRCFPAKYRARVVGSLFGFYGLCSSMLTGIYVGPFNNTDLAGYQLFMAISTAIVSLIAAVGLKPFRTDAFGGVSVDQDTEDPLLGDAEQTTKEKQLSPARYVLHVFLEKFCIPFALLFLSFFLATGAGLMHINNIGQLTESMNNGVTSSSAVLTAILIQSIGSGGGRILIGISDYFHIRRGWFYAGGVLMMMVAHLMAALIFKPMDETRIYGVTVLTGIAYGIIFGTAATLVTEMFPAKDFGQNWGWTLIAPAASSFFFNAIAGRFYDHQAELQNSTENLCIGPVCFRNAYFFSFGLTVLGFFLSLLLIRYTRYGLKRRGDPGYGEKVRNDSIVQSWHKEPPVIKTPQVETLADSEVAGDRL